MKCTNCGKELKEEQAYNVYFCNKKCEDSYFNWLHGKVNKLLK